MFQALSLLQPSQSTQPLKTLFEHAVVATGIFPNSAKPTAKDIGHAFLTQFQNQIAPATVTAFNSDFVIQFSNNEQKNTVLASRILQGREFCARLIPWCTDYGGQPVHWNTKVTINITGFPPHAFDPKALAPLLDPYCSIQTCGFNKARGVCRVNAYALTLDSIPKNGELGIQFPTDHGVCNTVFNAVMKTYPYGEAPDLGPDNYADFASCKAKTYCSDEEENYDSDVAREAFEDNLRAERELNGVQPQNNDSDSDYDSEGNYLRRQDSGFSIESDRSGHWI